jgi:hypothetical protein
MIIPAPGNKPLGEKVRLPGSSSNEESFETYLSFFPSLFKNVCG